MNTQPCTDCGHEAHEHRHGETDACALCLCEGWTNKNFSNKWPDHFRLGQYEVRLNGLIDNYEIFDLDDEKRAVASMLNSSGVRLFAGRNGLADELPSLASREGRQREKGKEWAE